MEPVLTYHRSLAAPRRYAAVAIDERTTDDEATTEVVYLGGKSWNGLVREHR